MKNIRTFCYCYLVFVLILVIQKPVFLCYHWNQSATESFTECLKVLWHGLSMDLSVAGYFSAIPGLVLWFSACYENKYTKKILQVYFALISLIISLIFIPDLELYSYWGFRIDSTVFNYIIYPKGAAASVSGWVIFALVAAIIIWTLLEYFFLNKTVIRTFSKPKQKKSRKITEIILFPFLLGFLFILIRGGITTSTMNVSRVYFSNNMYLNHAAINPCFNLLSSMSKPKNFNEQYHFMADELSDELFNNLINTESTDSIPVVLKNNHPNIVFILLESFSKVALEDEKITPHLNKLSQEGILFNRMYANSFRTDRGLVSVLSGYPAQPTMSIIKYPEKSQHLHSIPASLQEAGYKTSFLYGGDVNFAHIKSYLVSQGITHITKDTDFPISELLNKWGAPDDVTFKYLLKDIQNEQTEPYMKIFLTLSSHEPFDVPLHKFEDPYINSVAYTDSCLGMFIDSLKQTPAWDNMLLILVPDHGMKYPSYVQAYDPERFDIFMLWAGGAIKEAQTINQLCSQTDITSTLLKQMNIDHSKFIFSENILDPTYKEYAFYDFPDGFGLLSPNGKVVFDCTGNTILINEGNQIDSLLLKGKAYLQYLYNDIQKK